jgi:hypothetical protein
MTVPILGIERWYCQEMSFSLWRKNPVSLLLRNRKGSRNGSDLETELSGLALKIAEDTFFKELFVSLLAGFDVEVLPNLSIR